MRIEPCSLRWARHTVGGLLLAASAALAQAPAAVPPPAPLPAEFFYRHPDIDTALLSPSGRWLAVGVALPTGRTGLLVIDLQAKGAPVPVANYKDADVDEFHWVSDDWLVYDLTDRQRGGADQVHWPGLYGVRRDGSDRRTLVSSFGRWVGPETARTLPNNHGLLHIPDDRSNEIIVGEWARNGSGELEAVIPKRLNVATGRVRSIAAGTPPGARQWWFGPDGEPRAVLTRRQGKTGVHWRGPGDDQWRTLFEADKYAMPFSPRFVDGRGTLYVNQPTGSGDEVLKRYDFTRGEPEREPLVATPGFDFSGRMVSETAGSRALGVRVQVDAETTHWFDPRMKALQDEADRLLPGRINRLNCRRCDAPDMTVLVRSYNDRDPGQFWIHTAADGQWRKVGDVRRGTEVRRMATTSFERIATRDGQRMPVWITRPPGVQGPLPTVVLVHGGPWVRGRVWAWDADAQFLASRGYLVVEPEFRGSRGYGHAWYRAGWREWGRSMQDDVADALLWAVKQGQADPKRACIAGASYGGYSTLMGLVRHPELYRCGVAWVAVTDPRLMFEWRYGTDQSDEVRELDYPRLIGDPVADAERINAVTPVLHAARIQAPVLLAMGGEDRRVPLVHGRRMRDALTEAGRPPEWVVYDGEGHGWYQLSTRLDFARRLESFLEKHLRP